MRAISTKRLEVLSVSVDDVDGEARQNLVDSLEQSLFCILRDLSVSFPGNQQIPATELFRTSYEYGEKSLRIAVQAIPERFAQKIPLSNPDEMLAAFESCGKKMPFFHRAVLRSVAFISDEAARQAIEKFRGRFGEAFAEKASNEISSIVGGHLVRILNADSETEKTNRLSF